ncbi:MAG: competence/damage-inducible protein A [Chloroflexi bacterium]|nr:MAG: competence/damage-inducible protein A [Chloroflexota bacterium]MBL1196344.1 CinA family nicotinamide mononucleotide deamidase-related protein [Chloroflexota bacterium]NOH13639.1 CinA family nicotinamide mononucleotide deamidase-related protein [Chloroflexota bacterium]
MPTAEIIAIGTEILLGEIVDTNSRYIARQLRDIGVDLFYTAAVGDNTTRIAQAVQQSLQRAEIIITTGGLGPTIDDATREAVAQAVGVDVEFREELWKQIEQRFERFGRTPTENNRRQAYVPAGSIAIENPVGTAPVFIVETEKNAVIALPGVPREMEQILQEEIIPYLRKRFELKGLIKARVLHTSGAGESQIDDLITDLEELSNPTVGLAAHAGMVDLRITAKAESEEQADKMIAEVEAQLRDRLGEWIWGAGDEKLEEVALKNLADKGWQLNIVEAGLHGNLTQRLSQADGPFLGGEVLTQLPDKDKLISITRTQQHNLGGEVCLGASLLPGEDKQTLHIAILSPIKERQLRFTYGGPPQMAAAWAVNLCLNLLRGLESEGD